jgi:hypothetical protein
MVGFLAFFFPRIALLLVFFFSDYLQRAYDTLLWPLAGFIFLPLTTLAYAWAHNSNDGSISGIYLAVIVVAVLIDLGILGGNASHPTARKVYSRSN